MKSSAFDEKKKGNMDEGEPMLCYLVLETNKSPMLRGQGEGEIGRGGERSGGDAGENGVGGVVGVLVIVPSAFQSCF